MQNPVISNPNDYKVVTFHNSTEFGFTPDMGCMYDGRAINGNGGPGIQAGEKKMLPYHIGHRLAVNLAKRVLNTSQAATVDQAGIPTGVPIWNPDKLNELAKTFVIEEYSEDKPMAQSETDKLMAKVAELEKFMQEKLAGLPNTPPVNPPGENRTTEEVSKVAVNDGSKVFLDKAEVIAELEKRGIQHDKRKNKAELEKLLA